MKIKIVKAKKTDLNILNKELSVKEILWFHEEKLKEQEKGKSMWLIAWKNNHPIGHVQVRFNGSKITKVKSNLKNCPHIESLGVKEDYRKKGVGTKLMNYAENLVKKKGYKKVGLAVEKRNLFLEKLYFKRGYKNWGKGIVIDSWYVLNKKRNKQKVSEKCNYFIKTLK